MELDPSLASSRSNYGEEKYEKQEFQKIVNNKFHLMKDDSWKFIDALQDPQVIHQQIKDLVSNMKTENIELNHF